MRSTATILDDTTEAGSVTQLVDSLDLGRGVLLAVWAHPDDESFLAGGLLAEVTRRGGRVVNVNANSGEHGTDDPKANPPAVLARRREQELTDALTELGVETAVKLGYGDGACDQIPDAFGATVIGTLIDRVEPDVVVTFGPDGVTGHPDHRAVARWTRQAVQERGDHIPLVTAAGASVWPSGCIDRLHSIGAFWPGFPELDRVDAHVALDDELLDRKLAALARHASQMAPVEAALGRDGFRSVARREGYRAGNHAALSLIGRESPWLASPAA